MAPRKGNNKGNKRARSPSSSDSGSRSRSSSSERGGSKAKAKRPATAPVATRRTPAVGVRKSRKGSDNYLAAAKPGFDDLPCFGIPPPGDSDIQPEKYDPNLSLDKVGGLDDQVKYLTRRILAPLAAGTHKSEIARAALKPVKGVIFYGPPGTGKTLLAKSLAATMTRTNGKPVTFFMRRGTDVYSKYVGESERNLRTLFEKAHRMSPSIIFLDEIDGLCPCRREGLDTGHHTVSVTVSLLGLMDTVKPGEVVVIGATNRLSSLDPAMLRPGRFDQHLLFSAPNEEGRLSILEIKLNEWKGQKPGREILRELALRAVGFTGADLEKLIDRALDVALERQFPTFGTGGNFPKGQALESLQVTREDWLKALATTQKSNPEVFGGSSYTGNVMDERVRPLIQGIVSEIREKIADYTTEVDVCLGNKGVLVWAPTDSAVMDIDNLLFPAVIGSMDNRKFPAFILSLTSTTDVLSQALSSAAEKPTILVVPRLDYLMVFLKAKNLDRFFLDKFEQARGKNLTILASAVCGVPNLPETLQRLFQDKEMSYRLRPVTAEERTAFFTPIFHEQSKYHQGSKCQNSKTKKSKSNQLATFLKKAVDITANAEIGKLTTLHGQLTNACTRYFEQDKVQHQELMVKFEDILNSYGNQTNRSS